MGTDQWSRPITLGVQSCSSSGNSVEGLADMYRWVCEIDKLTPTGKLMRKRYRVFREGNLRYKPQEARVVNVVTLTGSHDLRVIEVDVDHPAVCKAMSAALFRSHPLKLDPEPPGGHTKTVPTSSSRSSPYLAVCVTGSYFWVDTPRGPTTISTLTTCTKAAGRGNHLSGQIPANDQISLVAPGPRLLTSAFRDSMPEGANARHPLKKLLEILVDDSRNLIRPAGKGAGLLASSPLFLLFHKFSSDFVDLLSNEGMDGLDEFVVGVQPHGATQIKGGYR
ncbi:protein of unknown function [Candidatus Bipolaricaulis anaerobius]|uniref:Uncharacterized protein n=1 Tax=Candidatus Bipolaricaulis anaerobius TaxID=2026885 RepID=A0A2X3K4G2_9BACT|nr:protein of unknown function [Candidatus Bipolaricaulis anaerobius]